MPGLGQKRPSREDSQDEGGSTVDDAFLKQWLDLLVGDKYGRASVKLAIVKPLFKPPDDVPSITALRPFYNAKMWRSYTRRCSLYNAIMWRKDHFHV